MDACRFFRLRKMGDAQLDAAQSWHPGGLGVQTVRRVEIPMRYRRFTRGGSEVLRKSRLPPHLQVKGHPKHAALSFASLQVAPSHHDARCIRQRTLQRGHLTTQLIPLRHTPLTRLRRTQVSNPTPSARED